MSQIGKEIKASYYPQITLKNVADSMLNVSNLYPRLVQFLLTFDYCDR